uniref:CRAL/TRIO N-terminal domain-containing protein n=1 Tax=Emiliania huxleyi TaxID=2903 RepID=A0A7S3WBN2_EMIHU
MAAAPAAAAPANAPQPPPQPPHPPPPAAASAPAPSPPAVAPAPVAAPAKPVAEPAFTDAEVEVLRTPLAPSEWCGSELHERALAYMRSRRDAAVLADPSLAPTVEMASDLRLWRFLVATAFKGGDAASMYVEALRWRKRNGTDATRKDLRAANPSFFTAGATSLETPLLTEQDAAVFAARPRTFFTKSAGGGGELLLDRAGNLLFIEVPASADAAAVCALGADAFLASELRTQELLQLVLDERNLPGSFSEPSRNLLGAASAGPRRAEPSRILLGTFSELSTRQVNAAAAAATITTATTAPAGS